MDIRISSEVAEYLSQKNKRDLTLTVHESGGGCCPTIESLDITLDAPSDSDGYRDFVVDGISVYLSARVRVIAPVLRFKLVKGFMSKEIVVEGLYLKGQKR